MPTEMVQPRVATEIMTYVMLIKKQKRRGWEQRGYAHVESVADHSYGVGMLAYTLGPLVGVDKDRAMQMAFSHDLAEAIVGDIIPADKIDKKEKHRMELAAFRRISATIPNGPELLDLFLEFEEGKTPVAQFVKRIDKLELAYQALNYYKLQPEIDQSSIWGDLHEFNFGGMQDIYHYLESEYEACGGHILA